MIQGQGTVSGLHQADERLGSVQHLRDLRLAEPLLAQIGDNLCREGRRNDSTLTNHAPPLLDWSSIINTCTSSIASVARSRWCAIVACFRSRSASFRSSM